MQVVTETPIQTVARKTRRTSARTTKHIDAEKTRLGLRLSVEAYRRLGTHSLMVGADMSEVVESLIMEHLRRFVVSDRAKSSTEATVIESASEAA